MSGKPVGDEPRLGTCPKTTGLGSGLVGDHIGDVEHHGGRDQAGYVFAREDLDDWEARLDRPLRIPCATFRGWIDEPRWLRVFTEQARPGAYLAVVTPATRLFDAGPDHLDELAERVSRC